MKTNLILKGIIGLTILNSFANASNCLTLYNSLEGKLNFSSFNCSDNEQGNVSYIYMNINEDECYSTEVLEKIFSFDTLETLHIDRFDGCENENYLYKNIANLPNLKELFIFGNDLDYDFSLLKNVQVQTLGFREIPITDKHIKQIDENSSIEHLVMNTVYDNLSEGSLSKLSNIKSLTIIGDVENVIENIATMPSLENLEIEFDNNKIEEIKYDVKSLKNIKSLTVKFSYSPKKEITLLDDAFKGLNLKKLHLEEHYISQNIIDTIGSMTELEELYLYSCNMPMREYSLNFASFKNLTQLSVISIMEDDNVYKIPDEFCSLPNLKSLTITDAMMKGIPDSCVNLKNSLEYLDLRNNYFSCEIPQYLNDFPKLKYVNFNSNYSMYGKVLTNENLETCYYSSYANLCMDDTDVKCLQGKNYGFPSCSSVSDPSINQPDPSATNDCNKIHTLLYENNLKYEDVILECIENDDGKVTQLKVMDDYFSESFIEKILSYSTIEYLVFERSLICVKN